MNAKIEGKLRRKLRIRGRIHGTVQRPRLTVSVSMHSVTAQLIDDDNGVTLAYADSKAAKVEGNLTQKAEWVGEEIAKAAKKAKVSKVVFDRNARKYHGRIKALADKAREAGLEF